jgi:hypothetical protein
LRQLELYADLVFLDDVPTVVRGLLRWTVLGFGLGKLCWDSAGRAKLERVPLELDVLSRCSLCLLLISTILGLALLEGVLALWKMCQKWDGSSGVGWPMCTVSSGDLDDHELGALEELLGLEFCLALTKTVFVECVSAKIGKLTASRSILTCTDWVWSSGEGCGAVSSPDELKSLSLSLSPTVRR